MSRVEICKLAEIDRTETIEHIYYLRNGKLILEPEHHVAGWNPDEKQKRIAGLQQQFDGGNIFFGAFDGQILVGMSVLDPHPISSGVHRLNLTGMWVSLSYRNRGIGKALFQLATNKARELGAKAMYVSATPSENTIRFYLSLGCRLAEPIDPDLFQLEPEDIHLEFIL